MANRHTYQIVGRYMNGKEITAYHLQDLDSGKSGKYSKDAVCLLIGKGQITNCSAQIYQGKVLLRGEGISLDSLPTKQENGGLSRTDGIGKVRRGTSVADAMTQLMLTKAIVSGRNVVGYVVTNAGGGVGNLDRQKTLEYAKAGRIGNARYQESNGRPILRGVGINLNELPVVQAADLGINIPIKGAQTNTGTPVTKISGTVIPVQNGVPIPDEYIGEHNNIQSLGRAISSCMLGMQEVAATVGVGVNLSQIKIQKDTPNRNGISHISYKFILVPNKANAMNYSYVLASIRATSSKPNEFGLYVQAYSEQDGKFHPLHKASDSYHCSLGDVKNAIATAINTAANIRAYI